MRIAVTQTQTQVKHYSPKTGSNRQTSRQQADRQAAHRNRDREIYIERQRDRDRETIASRRAELCLTWKGLNVTIYILKWVEEMKDPMWGECKDTAKTDVIKHFEEFGTRLMNGADDGSSSLSQRLEQKKALIARDTVQTTACNTHRADDYDGDNSYYCNHRRSHHHHRRPYFHT